MPRRRRSPGHHWAGKILAACLGKHLVGCASSERTDFDLVNPGAVRAPREPYSPNGSAQIHPTPRSCWKWDRKTRTHSPTSRRPSSHSSEAMSTGYHTETQPQSHQRFSPKGRRADLAGRDHGCPDHRQLYRPEARADRFPSFYKEWSSRQIWLPGTVRVMDLTGSSPVRWCTTSSCDSSAGGYAVRATGLTSSAGSAGV